jgi:hypothetical protein
LGIVEEGGHFGFSGGSQDIAHEVAHNVDGPVEGWLDTGLGVVTKVVEASSTGACFGFGKVGGIAVDV